MQSQLLVPSSFTVPSKCACPTPFPGTCIRIWVGKQATLLPLSGTNPRNVLRAESENRGRIERDSTGTAEEQEENRNQENGEGEITEIEENERKGENDSGIAHDELESKKPGWWQGISRILYRRADNSNKKNEDDNNGRGRKNRLWGWIKGKDEKEEVDQTFAKSEDLRVVLKELADPSLDNILSLVLTGLLALAVLQIAWQLILVTAAIILSGLKYTVIAAILVILVVVLL